MPIEYPRYIWKTAEDHWSARGLEHARELCAKLYGFTPDEAIRQDLEDPFEAEPLASLVELTVTYVDGAEQKDGGGAYPGWVDEEVEARVKWLGKRVGKGIAQVTAPAWVWARNVEGMVSTTNI